MAVRYSHTQTGGTMRILVVAILVVAFTAVIVSLTKDPRAPQWVWPVVLIPLAISVLSVWIFSRLTVVVDEQALRWFYGAGIPRFSIPRGEIRSAQRIKVPWFFGMGIHYIPGSPGKWVYNVGLGEAVQVTRHDGSVVCIGSDDAATLVSTLTT